MSEIYSLREAIEESAVEKLDNLWLSSKEVQKILGISQKTWQTYRDKKLIPFTQVGQKIYVEAADLKKFMEDHKISSGC